ncbi:unnamed protein product, partial [Mesorhabditis belari]|uniref:Cation efflux protein cytoplasmic domain-containing protein n=1 Tax=Mesorhabditis belari TaxID=2138241 RepID=A0AAF3FPU9_9BILA
MKLFTRLRERQKRIEMKEYESQRDELKSLYENDDLRLESDEGKGDEERGTDRLLSRIAIVLNLLLLSGNLTASILSGSLAIISTLVDSAMDLTSNIIIGLCLILIQKTNNFHYPRGRERLELVGVLVCSILMGVANIVVIFQSILAIVGDNMNAKLDYFSGGLMLAGAGLKIVLAVICFKRGTPSSKILAIDMRNDAVTCLTAFFAVLIAHKWWKYADPIGAILVCSVIAFNWFSHAIENIPQLVGVRGESHLLSRVIRVSIKHDQRIRKIDHAMVYQTGSTATVEIHIVLDENMPLKETHNICHPLEKKLSRLDGVERAFVHCDYECDGDHFIEGLSFN